MAEEHSSSGIADALARIVNGCYILTHRDAEGVDRGILLSFVQQIGFDPPRITVGIRKGRPTVEALERTRQFVLNVCAVGNDALVRRFAQPPADASQVFAGLDAETTPAGLQLKAASAHLTCQVHQRVDAGDHWLYIADVLDGSSTGDRAPFVNVRRHGLGY